MAATDPKVKDPPTQWRFHWVGRPDRKVSPRQGSITASIQGQEVRVEKTNLDSVEIWLNDKLLDLSRPVAFWWKGAKVHEGMVPRTAAALYRSVDLRGDREMIHSARVVVTGQGAAGLARRRTPAFRLGKSGGRLLVDLGPGRESERAELRITDPAGRTAAAESFRGRTSPALDGLRPGLWIVEVGCGRDRLARPIVLP